MIWCVPWLVVVEHLRSLGYEFAFSTQLTVVFETASGEVFTFKNPNQGHITEQLITDALDRADLPVPDWDGLYFGN